MTFKIKISHFFWLKWTQTMGMKQNQTIFHGAFSNPSPYLFYQKILQYFNDLPNQKFSVLWLQWTQTMEMKQNKSFFHGTYSNLTSFLIGHKILKYFNRFYSWHLFISLQNETFLISKDIKAFPWLSKSKFASVMTKVSPNNGNEAKSDIFPWEFSNLTPCLFYLFCLCWLQWVQRMEMKQNQTYFHGTYSNLTSFLIGHKILKYFNRFYSWHLFISLQKWAQPS